MGGTQPRRASGLRRPGRGALAAALAALPLALGALPAAAAEQAVGPVYPTFGVHNPPSASPCASPDCDYRRSGGQPTDPVYPAHWTSHWAMYRVFKGYKDHPPPYEGVPPAPLRDGVDYETSYGETSYDADWARKDGTGGTGAMMERYDKLCLPIFPKLDRYSCAFISLGDTAYFLKYNADQSKVESVCLFSPSNHAPRRDFIAHLPYSAADSARLERRVQSYSFWVGMKGPPVQTGVQPDRTADHLILFGYAFESLPRPDAVDRSAAPYRHPQSFFFSGWPKKPVDAPIVSQNYTDFAMNRPDPKTTWDLVSNLDVKSLPACTLFHPSAEAERASPELVAASPETLKDTLDGIAAAAAHQPPTWGDLGQR